MERRIALGEGAAGTVSLNEPVLRYTGNPILTCHQVNDAWKHPPAGCHGAQRRSRCRGRSDAAAVPFPPATRPQRARSGAQRRRHHRVTGGPPAGTGSGRARRPVRRARRPRAGRGHGVRRHRGRPRQPRRQRLRHHLQRLPRAGAQPGAGGTGHHRRLRADHPPRADARTEHAQRGGVPRADRRALGRAVPPQRQRSDADRWRIHPDPHRLRRRPAVGALDDPRRADHVHRRRPGRVLGQDRPRCATGQDPPRRAEPVPRGPHDDGRQPLRARRRPARRGRPKEGPDVEHPGALAVPRRLPVAENDYVHVPNVVFSC